MVKVFYKSKLFLLLGGLFCLSVVLLVMVLVTKGKPSTPITTGPVGGTKKVITEAVRDVIASKSATMKIGKDTISRSDLDNVARVTLNGKNLSSMTASEQAQLVGAVTERSVVLQEANKQGFVKVDDSLFNSGKNAALYETTYAKAAQSIIDKSEKISVKGIMIFYYNTFPPKMGIEQAKQVTRAKMDKYHEDLVSGKITIDQAADLIRKDASLAEIDEIYKDNAYVQVINATKDYSTVVAGLKSEDNAKLWEMKTGEFTPVLLGSEGGKIDKATGVLLGSEETFWTILQVTDKRGSGPSYLTWLKNAEKQYVQN